MNSDRVVFWATLLFVFTVPWRNMVHLGESVGTIGRVLGIIVATFWAINVIYTRRVRMHATFAVLAGAFLLWSLLSIMWSADSAAAISDVTRYLFLVVMVVVILDVYNSEERVHLGLQSFVLGAAVGVIVLLAAFFMAGGFEGSFRRLSVPGYNPNRFGGILAIALPLSVYLLYHQRDGLRWLAVINGVFIPLAGFGVMLTGSRQAMVALAPTVLLLLYLGVSDGQSVLTGVVGVATIGGLLSLPFVLPERLTDRIMSIPEEITSGTLGGRGPEITDAVSLIMATPFHGVGAGNRLASPHNTYLRIGMELGLVGVILFVAVLGLTAMALMRIERGRAALFAVFAAWGLVSLTNHWNLHATTWLLVALMLALDPALGRRRWSLSVFSVNVTAYWPSVGMLPSRTANE